MVELQYLTGMYSIDTVLFCLYQRLQSLQKLPFLHDAVYKAEMITLSYNLFLKGICSVIITRTSWKRTRSCTISHCSCWRCITGEAFLLSVLCSVFVGLSKTLALDDNLLETPMAQPVSNHSFGHKY